MSEMIETVAKALCEASGSEWRTGTYPAMTGPNFEMEDHDADRLNNRWRLIARAAIEAMREPTEAMVEAFAEAGFDAREAAREENRRRKLPHPAAIAECQWVPQAFRAAIDAALSQDTHSLPSEDRQMSERWKAHKAEFVWHGEHPDCEDKVRAEIEHDLCDLARAVDLVFHECWLDGDPDGPTVLLWGLKGDKRLHCEFISRNSPSLPTPAATPTDSANPPPVGSVGPNSEEQS